MIRDYIAKKVNCPWCCWYSCQRIVEELIYIFMEPPIKLISNGFVSVVNVRFFWSHLLLNSLSGKIRFCLFNQGCFLFEALLRLFHIWLAYFMSLKSGCSSANRIHSPSQVPFCFGMFYYILFLILFLSRNQSGYYLIYSFIIKYILLKRILSIL